MQKEKCLLCHPVTSKVRSGGFKERSMLIRCVKLSRSSSQVMAEAGCFPYFLTILCISSFVTGLNFRNPEGRWDGSAGKDTYSHAWQPEIQPETHRVKERALQNCATTPTHAPSHTQTHTISVFFKSWEKPHIKDEVPFYRRILM